MRAGVPAAAWLALALLSACATDAGPHSANAAAAANIQLGSAYLQQGNLPIAKEKLERALAEAPRNPTVHGLLAMLYVRLGDDRRAEAEYRTALSLAPGDPEQLNNYAVYLCSAGRVDEGVSRFQEAARNALYRTPWAAYSNAGVCLRSARRNAEAETLFARALHIRADYAEAAVQLADLELSEDRANEAYSTVADFLKSNPPTAELLLLGWRAARAQHNAVNAAQMAWRLQNEFPDSDQAHAVTASAGGKG